MNNNTINITPAPSALGPFVPTGSYQKNCKNITITVLCNSLQEDGTENPTVLSYSATEVNQIYDIMNGNGTLALFKGTANPNPVASLGPFVPGGSYQTTSKNISVIIEAQCLAANNTYQPSILQYSAADVGAYIDIANVNGVLTRVTCYQTLATQVNANLEGVTANLNTACKSAIVTAALDPLNRFQWRNIDLVIVTLNTPMYYQLNDFVGLSSIEMDTITVAITGNTNQTYTGTVSVTAKFGKITGEISAVLGEVLTGAGSVSLTGYTLQASGSISIEVNKEAFSISAVNLNDASASCVSSQITLTPSLTNLLFDNTVPIVSVPTIPRQLATVIGTALTKLT